MPITPDQRKARQHYIGASDVPAILNVDPWRNCYDVFLEKTGKLVDDDEVMPWQDTGLQLEGALLDWFKRSKHCPSNSTMRRNVEMSYKPLNLKVHPDAIIYQRRERLACVEAKTSGLFGPLTETWGDWMTAKVPTRVFVQCTAQMMATGTRRCYIPAFIGMRGIGCFVVMWKQSVVDEITKAVTDFLRRIKEDDPPPITPTLSVVKKRKRVASKVETNHDAKQIVEDWLAEKETANQAKKDAEAAQAKVITLMKDAEVLDFGGTSGCLTYFADKRGVRTLRVSNNWEQETA